jgi:hypothetical protein
VTSEAPSPRGAQLLAKRERPDAGVSQRGVEAPLQLRLGLVGVLARERRHQQLDVSQAAQPLHLEHERDREPERVVAVAKRVRFPYAPALRRGLGLRQQRGQPVVDVRVVAQPAHDARERRQAQAGVVENEPIPDEPVSRPWVDAVVERDRQHRVGEVVPEAHGEHHDVRVRAQALALQHQQLLARPEALHAHVGRGDPVVARVEQMREGLLVGDAVPESDRVSDHHHARGTALATRRQLSAAVAVSVESDPAASHRRDGAGPSDPPIHGREDVDAARLDEIRGRQPADQELGRYNGESDEAKARCREEDVSEEPAHAARDRSRPTGKDVATTSQCTG